MSKCVVACSGGPDSMALLDQLNKQGKDIVVAHVNYNIAIRQIGMRK